MRSVPPDPTRLYVHPEGVVMPARKHRPGKYPAPSLLTNPMTPEEHLLLAIFGRDDGATVDETPLRMRQGGDES